MEITLLVITVLLLLFIVFVSIIAILEIEADPDELDLEVHTNERQIYYFPSIDLLENVPDDDAQTDEDHLAELKRRLRERLRIFNIPSEIINTTIGIRDTLIEIKLAPDVRVSRLTSIKKDIAVALSSSEIRIIAPIFGKDTIGVEIPNRRPNKVWLRSVLQVEKFKNSTMTLPIVLGKTISKEYYIADLAEMPHLLIAGRAGSGKSVCINVIISSLLYACDPDKVKFVLIDRKRVELFQYQDLKNHFLVRFPRIEEQIITDPQKAVYALKCVAKEMEHRYEILEKAGVPNIKDLNSRLPGEALPYIVVVIDELADLLTIGKEEVEESIIKIAQLARPAGIHLIMATEHPSANVIRTIVGKAFFRDQARIAFRLANEADSRTILNDSGAEQLFDSGDMLYLPSDGQNVMRLQVPYVSSREVEKITSFIGAQQALKTMYVLPVPDSLKRNGSQSSGSQDNDDREPPVNKFWNGEVPIEENHFWNGEVPKATKPRTRITKTIPVNKPWNIPVNKPWNGEVPR